MIRDRYTAILVHKETVLFEKSHSDFFEVQASLLARLHDKYDNARGIIIDNVSGQTVHSCKKISCFD
jgi:hypothetical protein